MQPRGEYLWLESPVAHPGGSSAAGPLRGYGARSALPACAVSVRLRDPV